MSSAGTVVASVDVAVDPDTAFEVFTAEIDAWYQRGPHSWKFPDRARGIKCEPGVGGRLLEVHDDATGEGFEFGRIIVWEPGARLVFTDLTSSAPPDPLTEVDVRFEALAGGTRVTLEHRGLDRLPPGVAAQKRMYGWQTLLAWFGEHLRRGATMPTEVGYLTISVTDTDRAQAFYGSLFGWAFEAGNAGEGYAHISNTKLPMGIVPEGRGAGTRLYFRVDDIDAAIRRVHELGGDATDPKEYPSGLNSECRDDQGTTFDLWQPAPGF